MSEKAETTDVMKKTHMKEATIVVKNGEARVIVEPEKPDTNLFNSSLHNHIEKEEAYEAAPPHRF